MEGQSLRLGASGGRAIVVSSLYSDAEMVDRIGREAYSYRFVYRAFAPLLQRWGRTVEITHAESRLDYALWQARQQQDEPLHLSFLPPHLTYLTQRAPNVVFPFWEFPDIPNSSIANNPRNDWVRLSEHLDQLLTACTFTRDAFLRAGVTTPIHVVPVPIAGDYFTVPAWQPDQRVVLDCPCYVFPLPEAPPASQPNPWVPATTERLSLKAKARRVYKCYVKPRIPARVDKYLTVALRTVAAVRGSRHEDVRIPYPVSTALDLSGVVYTTILNPFDPRKNWQDLFSAFLLALGDCEDATLVVKMVVCPHLTPPAVNGMVHYYQTLGIRHRCKLIFVPTYLSDAQMVQLAQASTFYVNSAKAEGACLPLQDYLAAGRPGIAPRHTAMLDYFDDNIGFVVASHPEPAPWPHDPEQRLRTRWNRLVWQSLYDQFRTSYAMAKQDTARYQALAVRGRERMADYASAERVWPKLAAALNAVVPAGTHAERGHQQLDALRPVA
jgi:glycosyltransferase involved in cell wall biosynthesis